MQHPISRLSVELLLLVFDEVKLLHETTNHASDTANGAVSKVWIPLISHVCRLWRFIALDSPRFWCDILVSYKDHLWAAEKLVRSKNAVLNVEIDFQHMDHATRTIISTLQNEVARCRRLRLLSRDENDFFDFLSPNIILEGLHSLRLFACPSNDDDRKLALSDDTLKVTQLRELAVCGVTLDLSSTFLHHLTHLRLFSIPYETSPTARQLLNLFTLMQKLEVVEIRDTLRQSDEEYEDILAPICLPALKFLTVADFMDETFMLLLFLTLPRTVAVELEPAFDTENAESIREQIHEAQVLLSRLALHISSTSTTRVIPASDYHIQSALVVGGVDKFRLMCYTQPDIASWRDFCLQFSGKWDRDGSLPLSRLHRLGSPSRSDFVGMIPQLQHLVVLRIANLSLEADEWGKVFGSIRTLESISIQDYGPAHSLACFLTALMYVITARNSNSNTADLSGLAEDSRAEPSFHAFQALRSLTVDFDAPVLFRHMHFSDRDSLRDVRVGDAMTQAFESRKTSGFPLQELIFCKNVVIGTEDRDIVNLRNVVGTVKIGCEPIDFGELLEECAPICHTFCDDEDAFSDSGDEEDQT